MKTLFLAVSVLALSLGPKATAAAVNETPASVTAIVFEPMAFEVDAREEVITALDSANGQYYAWEKAIQFAVSDTPSVTLPDFADQLPRGHGVFFLTTHGTGTVGWAVEVFDTTLASYWASYWQYQYYLGDGWNEFWGHNTDFLSNRRGWKSVLCPQIPQCTR